MKKVYLAYLSLFLILTNSTFQTAPLQANTCDLSVILDVSTGGMFDPFRQFGKCGGQLTYDMCMALYKNNKKAAYDFYKSWINSIKGQCKNGKVFDIEKVSGTLESAIIGYILQILMEFCKCMKISDRAKQDTCLAEVSKAWQIDMASYAEDVLKEACVMPNGGTTSGSTTSGSTTSGSTTGTYEPL